MSTFVHSFSSRTVLCIDHTKYETIRDLKVYLSDTKGIPLDASFFICNGGIVDDDEPVMKDVVYHTYLRILGGKGGFGSMLRAIGAQIEKTTNHEACRDLSGRRMRDVNNEKDLKDWLSKQTEREKEREQRRQDRLARRRAMPNHKFDDPMYDKQRALLAENQDDALQKGLKKSQPVAGPSSTVTSEDSAGIKRKAETTTTTSKKKKATEWLGVDIDNLSDLDSDVDDDVDDDGGTGSDEPTSGQQSHVLETSCSSSDNISQHTHTNNQTMVRLHSQDTDGVNSETISNENQPCPIKTTEIINKTGEMCTVSSLNETEEKKPFDLDEATSVQEVELQGLDKLKAELMSRGLKCGGTLEQRAQRLFSIKGLTKEQIDPSLFAKSVDGKNVKRKK